MSTGTRMTMAAAAATVLGSAPIGSTFREQQWAVYAWFGVGVLMLVHLGARRVRVPATLVPVVALVAFGLYLTFMFTPSHAFLSFVPTFDSLRELRGALRNGFTDVRTLSTPAPATPGLTLLATGGVGLVAIAVDAVAVGLRRPAAAGLVLLSMYAIPTAVAFDGVGWLPFVLAGCGYLLLLLAEGHERMLRWGRPVPYDDLPDQEPRPWPIRTTGKRVGLAALAVALAVPLLIPGFNNNSLYLLFGGSGNGSGGHRLGGSSLSPFTQMRNQLLLDKPQDVMQIQTNQRRPFYIRQTVLDQVDKQGNWKRGRLTGGQSASSPLDLPEGTFLGNDEQRFRATFQIKSGYQDNTLPLYGLPTRIDGLPGSWNYVPDVTTAYSRAADTGNLHYTERFADSRPTAAQLEASPVVSNIQVRRTWAKVPAGLPSQVTDTVQSLIDGTSTPYDRTLAIFDYFLGPDSGFIYSLSTKPGTSGNDLVDFLTNRQGFCQQYSSAMALMLRVARVPARVVVGYTPGARRDGRWVVRTDNAHAWVEAYFAGLGWVPFDPTPLPGNSRIEQPYAPRPGDSATPNPSAGSATVSPGTRATDPNKLPAADRQGGGSGGAHAGLVTPRRAVTTLVLLIVLLLLLAPMVTRFANRRRRLRDAAGAEPATAAHSAWDELLATAEDLQLTLRAA
ncbi:MAG TPA: DUF3488 and transglutaminase-like domain-containing protein, partial [Mycobacteriales bacterium]|nr:DUF3488 and transglutaminase-like domain-containing protein [Mycobacteriales bacterium]